MDDLLSLFKREFHDVADRYIVSQTQYLDADCLLLENGTSNGLIVWRSDVNDEWLTVRVDLVNGNCVGGIKISPNESQSLMAEFKPCGY